MLSGVTVMRAFEIVHTKNNGWGKKDLLFDKPEAEASRFKPLTVGKDGPTFSEMKMKRKKVTCN